MTKRVEKNLHNICHLCYDNRIQILTFFPFTDHISASNGLVFHYEHGDAAKPTRFYQFGRGESLVTIAGNNERNQENQKFPSLEGFFKFLIKILYGYFRTDPTRKIYFLEWRLRLALSLAKGTKSVMIRVQNIILFGSRVFEICVVGDEDNSMSDLKLNIDFSGVRSLYNFGVYCSLSQEKVLYELTTKRMKLESLLLTRDKKIQKISVKDLNALCHLTTSVYLKNYNVVEYSRDFHDRVHVVPRDARCRSLSFTKMKINFYSEFFFQSFVNLRAFLGRQLVFRTPHDLIEFFENIRKYSPRLRFISLHILDVEDHENNHRVVVGYDKNLLTVLCKDNSYLRELIIEFGPFLLYDLDSLLEFTNETLYHLVFRNFRTLGPGNDENLKNQYKLMVFKRIFRCFPALSAFGFRNITNNQDIISELPEILRILPKTVEGLYISFFDLVCSKNLFESFVSVKDQLKELSFSFSNALDFLNDLFTLFSNLSYLKIFSPVHQRERFLRNQIVFVPTKEILITLRDNMKNLKSLEFGLKDCEPIIYFLKYSEHTQHIRRATNLCLASNFPRNPFPINSLHEALIDEVIPYKTSKPSDYLFFNEFDRDSEYFDKSIDSNLKFKNMVRRREACLFRRNEKFSWEFNNEIVTPIPRNKTLFLKVMEDFEIFPNYSQVEKEELKNSFMSSYYFSHAYFSSEDDLVIGSKFRSFLVEMKIDQKLPNNNNNNNVSITTSKTTLFSRRIESGNIFRYDFISPSGLDFLRFCISQQQPEQKKEENGNIICYKKEKWISRKNFIRLICSMVGIDVKNGIILENCFSDEEDNGTGGKEINCDMKWIFREAQRIYNIKFEELRDDSVNFVDSMLFEESVEIIQFN